jgi:Pentapeptide repeats (8 copies)
MRHRHTALVEKSSDLEAFRDSVNDAAGVSAGLWLTYLLVLSYLLVAAGEVTHRNLLLEDPVKLPFLNVDLPLVGFFLVGPAIFVLVHAYVLLHFTLLAGKIGAFHTELQKQVVDAVVRARIRRQLPINVFVQLLAGPREVRNGVVGIMLWVLAHVSLVLGPLALLIFFQLQFLPYHDAVVTWCQRIMVVVDLVLLWMLWPAIVRCETVELSWRNSRFGTKLSIGLVSLIPVLLTFGIVTFPGEWIEMTLPSIWLIRSKDRGENRLWPMTSVRDLLVDGTVDPRHGKLTSYWSNRLVLPDIDVIDHAKYDTEPKIAALSETIFLRARNLTDAVLTNAVLRKANFEAALLDRAVMDGADLRDAKFICASGSVEKVDCAQLGEASLTAAHLQGASFDYAQMQGVKLLSAELQGANLRFAHLEGAKMPGAQLQGGSFGRLLTKGKP